MMDTSIMRNSDGRLMINMGGFDTKMFFISIATSIIIHCRETLTEEDFGILVHTSNIPHYDKLIDNYCDGVHGAIMANSLHQNVAIIHSFVRECVRSKSREGLFLMTRQASNIEPMWKILCLALDEYVDFQKRQYGIIHKEVPSDILNINSYNEEFEKLMEN